MIFISYKSEEREMAYRIKSTLESNGFACWMAPDSVMPGADFGFEIPNAIEQCDAFVLVLSASAQKSVWIRNEIDEALQAGKVIIPFKIDNAAIKKEFNYRLNSAQRIEAYNRLSDAFEQLVDCVSKICSERAQRSGEDTDAPEAPAPSAEKPQHDANKKAKPTRRAPKDFIVNLDLYHMAIADAYYALNNRPCPPEHRGKFLGNHFSSVERVERGYFPYLSSCIVNSSDAPILITNYTRAIDAIGVFTWEEENIHTTGIALAFDDDSNKPLVIKPGEVKEFVIFGRNLLMLFDAINKGTFEYFAVAVNGKEYRFGLEDFDEFREYYNSSIKKDIEALKQEDKEYRLAFLG